MLQQSAGEGQQAKVSSGVLRDIAKTVVRFSSARVPQCCSYILGASYGRERTVTHLSTHQAVKNVDQSRRLGDSEKLCHVNHAPDADDEEDVHHLFFSPARKKTARKT